MGRLRSHWDKAANRNPQPIKVNFTSIDGLSLAEINQLTLAEYQERANQLQTQKRKNKNA